MTDPFSPLLCNQIKIKFINSLLDRSISAGRRSMVVHKESGELSLSKVCIPLYCYGGRGGHNRECNICVVDLSTEEKTADDFSNSPPTTFKIKYVPDYAAYNGFCGLGNRVYIFESCGLKEKNKKAVYYIDICESVSTPLLYSDLPKIGEMLCDKYNPAVLVVPNTCKILVFPTEAFHGGFVLSRVFGGFELFDTVDGSSRELPSLEITVPVRSCHVEAYGFVDNHRVLVQIFGEVYVLDMDSLDKGWVPMPDPAYWINRSANATSFDVVEGRFYFQTSYGLIRDLRVRKMMEGREEEEDYDCYLWVLSEVTFDMNNSQQYFLTLLNHNEQVRESCICRLSVEGGGRPKKSIRMQFDVAVVDLKRYEREMDPNTDYTRFVKSLRYSLDLQGDEYEVFPHRNFFSF